MYHIPHQLSGNCTKLFFNDYLNEIDFSAVDKIYDILKEESMSFLFNALKLRNNAS